MDKGITIVIPVKDRSALIGRCLDSISAQTLKPEEVIVVDNASSDPTVSVVEQWRRKHPDVRISILSEPKPGASAARNRGLSEVKTEFVIFFDSDDSMEPDLLESASAAAGEGVDIVQWKAETVGLDGVTRRKTFYDDGLLRRQFYNCVLSTQTYMVRTSLVREAGGWEENAMVWNDWELGIRLALANPRRRVIDRTLVKIFAQENSITGTAFSLRAGDWENTLDIVEKKIRNSQLSIRDRRRLLHMVIYRRVILAARYSKEGDVTGARNLLAASLKHPLLRKNDRLLLKLIYRYTSLGGRGAYYLWK